MNYDLRNRIEAALKSYNLLLDECINSSNWQGFSTKLKDKQKVLRELRHELELSSEEALMKELENG